jgi:hypothetical protein
MNLLQAMQNKIIKEPNKTVRCFQVHHTRTKVPPTCFFVCKTSVSRKQRTSLINLSFDYQNQDPPSPRDGNSYRKMGTADERLLSGSDETLVEIILGDGIDKNKKKREMDDATCVIMK